MKGKSIASLVCGILSLEGIFGCFANPVCAIIGLALGIVAIVLSSGVKNAGSENGMSKAGFVCGLIGLILSAIGLIVGIITCAVCAAAGAI
ncbi:MAG: hypothetical protein HDT13_03205 [Butyrivibrio sp.]|nr:hypothetical protein [Butyrivibrio sp.]